MCTKLKFVFQSDSHKNLYCKFKLVLYRKSPCWKFARYDRFFEFSQQIAFDVNVMLYARCCVCAGLNDAGWDILPREGFKVQGLMLVALLPFPEIGKYYLTSVPAC